MSLWLELGRKDSFLSSHECLIFRQLLLLLIRKPGTRVNDLLKALHIGVQVLRTVWVGHINRFTEVLLRQPRTCYILNSIIVF